MLRWQAAGMELVGREGLPGRQGTEGLQRKEEQDADTSSTTEWLRHIEMPDWLGDRMLRQWLH
jgi:hypothetical protein